MSDFKDIRKDCEDLVEEIAIRKQSVQRELGSRLHGYGSTVEEYEDLSISELEELAEILR